MCLWNEQGQLLAILEGHTGQLHGTLILADGRPLSWEEDCTLRSWDTYGNPLAVYHADGAITCCIEASPGRITSGDLEECLVVMDIVG